MRVPVPRGRAGLTLGPPLAERIRHIAIHAGGRQHPGRDLHDLRAARRRARVPSELEHRPANRCGCSDDLRQVDRLSGHAAGRKHQVPVGTEPAPGARGACASLAPGRGAALPGWLPDPARVLVRAVPVPEWPELDEQPRARTAPGQLVGGLAAASRRRIAALRVQRKGQLSAALARVRIPALPIHSRTPLAAFVRKQSPARRTTGPVCRCDDLAAVAHERGLAAFGASQFRARAANAGVRRTASIASRRSGTTTRWRTCC